LTVILILTCEALAFVKIGLALVVGFGLMFVGFPAIKIRLRSTERELAAFDKIDPTFTPKDSLLRASAPTSQGTLLRAAPTTRTELASELLRPGSVGDAEDITELRQR
jgi:hypothetical protein